MRDFTWMKPSENNLVPPCSEKIILNEVCEADVYKELNNLKRKKETGLDNLPPGLRKDASILAKPLTHVINLSFKTVVVPTDWKEAKVVPVYKSGPRSQVDNYRSISILPTLSKILGKLFHKQLMNHVEKRNGLLFNYQCGFRAKRSTEQAVIYFLDHIRSEADKGRLTGALFSDLSKAFDTKSLCPSLKASSQRNNR